jgi:hypothetical protein
MMTDFGGFNMDVTTYTMILVTKLWGLSWAFKDGAELPSKLSEAQIERKVIHMPTVLEYYSFVCFCCGGVVGPFIEFSMFKNWIELSGQYKNMPRKGTLRPALIRIFQGITCLALHILIVVVLGCSVYYCGTKEFLEYGNLITRCGYFYLAMTGQRFAYYTPWCFSDASLMSCGFAWDDKKKNWFGIVNADIIGIETSGSIMEQMKLWNHQIHQWLKHYVQTRVSKPGVKPG